MSYFGPVNLSCMKRAICFVLLALNLGILPELIAQKDHAPVGGRARAMGGTNVCMADLWSMFNNQAGLADLRQTGAGIYAENRFLMKELSRGAIGFVLPVKNAGVFAINYQYSGYSLYNESMAGLAYALSFNDRISAGIQLDYLFIRQGEDYGNAHLVTFEAGFRALLYKNLVLGVHVFNPVHTRLSKYGPDRVPVILKGGLSYAFSEKALVSVETEKDLNQKACFRMGLEYHLIKPVFLRAGAGTAPFCYGFGLGLETGKFRLDISADRHQTLGFSPQLSLIYAFKKTGI